METVNYKPLEKKFKSKGFDYRQLDRVGDVAIFEQTKEGLTGTWYEVVIVQKHDERIISDVRISPAEAMPPASAWGKKGWTFRDNGKAFDKFSALSAS